MQRTGKDFDHPFVSSAVSASESLLISKFIWNTVITNHLCCKKQHPLHGEGTKSHKFGKSFSPMNKVHHLYQLYDYGTTFLHLSTKSGASPKIPSGFWKEKHQVSDLANVNSLCHQPSDELVRTFFWSNYTRALVLHSKTR